MVSVAFDATAWDDPVTGIGLVARELYRALVTRGLTVERWGGRVTGEHTRGGWSRTMWTLAQLPRLMQEHHPDVFHALGNFNLPLRRVDGVATVLTVHDLIPLLLPDTVSTRYRLQFQAWLTRSLNVADAVICPSEVVKRSVCEHFDVAVDRITVVHHGVDHVDRVAPADAITTAWLDSFGMKEPFVLYAGALDARKNVELVVEAVERLHRGGVRTTLAIAGQPWFGAARIRERVERARAAGVDIRMLGYLHDRVFFAVMKRAGVFVFPSRYEGFGLPPLEAMRLGVPTIVSTEGSLPEVCGDGALSVLPDDATGLAERIAEVLRVPSVRESLIERGRSRARHLTWAKAAARTVEVYDRARRRAPPL